MTLSEHGILQALMKGRARLSAAAWVVVRDAHAAEDIFQNVAVKAMTRDVRFATEGELMSWAFITARREGIDWLRRHQREICGLDAGILELLEQDWRTTPPSQAGARVEALQACLESAPKPARRLLRLRYYEGRSCEEVASAMGLGLDAIYKRISRLHESLRECIEGRLSSGPAPDGGNP